MVSINKISSMPIKSFIKPNVKNVAKVTLPIASGLGVLAGSSLGGREFFHGAPAPLGSSVTDPFWDQIEYTGEKALDCISEIGDAIGDGASSVADGILDFIGDALDFMG